jgi:predicted nucleotidyltransferase
MQKRSFGSVTIFSIDEAEVRRAVDEYAARLLASHPEIEEIVVFGSFAKGNYAPGSDVDIFILLSDSDKPIRDRIPGLLPGDFPVAVDLFPYTREEVAARADSPFLAEVQRSSWRYHR